MRCGSWCSQARKTGPVRRSVRPNVETSREHICQDQDNQELPGSFCVVRNKRSTFLQESSLF